MAKFMVLDDWSTGQEIEADSFEDAAIIVGQTTLNDGGKYDVDGCYVTVRDESGVECTFILSVEYRPTVSASLVPSG